MKRLRSATRFAFVGIVSLIALFTLVTPNVVATSADSSVDSWVRDLAQVQPQCDAKPLSTFAGVIRLPRREFALFDGLAIGQAHVTRDSLTQRLTYMVRLGDGGSGSIEMSGVVGRRPELDADPSPDCLKPGPNYCADTGYIQGPPTGESFFHLQSQSGNPGRVNHGVCCNGHCRPGKAQRSDPGQS